MRIDVDRNRFARGALFVAFGAGEATATNEVNINMRAAAAAAAVKARQRLGAQTD